MKYLKFLLFDEMNQKVIIVRNEIRFIVLVLCLGLSAYSVVQGQPGRISSFERESNVAIFNCENGEAVKVSMVTDEIFRVQVAPKGAFNESVMIKWGFVKDDFPTVNFEIADLDDHYLMTTSALKLYISKRNFRFKVLDLEGNLIVRQNGNQPFSTGKQNTLNFDMPADEHFFGFGFMRKTLDARGQKLTWKREYRWKEATVPYFMSTRGYAFYSNNAYNHDFDFTNKSDAESANYYSITNNGGQIDFYIIYGPSFPALLDRYTDLTGKTLLVPKWAFGLEYRLRYYGNDQEFLKVAKGFREKEIPCDIMALEPGWEEKTYSMDWKWSKKRFPEPKKMIKELNQMGFKVDLWESGIAPTENITDPKVRAKWFAKRKDVINSGVQMFKQDDPYPRSISSTELTDPVFARNVLKAESLSQEELNNVTNSLYSQTYFEEYRKLTNERAMIMFHAYNASVASHRWPFQWAGDFQAANGMINASLSGHAMVSYDIRNPYAAGWHQGFFTPFSVVDSWAYYREPWLYSESIEHSHRLYACLRSRLVPYFYSSLWQSHKTALPIERPMVLNYSNDPNTYQMRSQFMVGDWFLLGLSDADDSPSGEKVDFWTGSQKGNEGRIYLPKGKWIDYWNGEVRNIDKAQWVSGKWPKYMGGLLFVKAGAIIPMGQVKNYIGETIDEVITLDIYPHQSSSYQMYEDDGITYDYEKEAFALTDIAVDEDKEQININVSKRKGKHKDMSERRTFLVKVHSMLKPKAVAVDGAQLKYFDQPDALIYDTLKKGWYYDTESKKVIIKLDKGWMYSLKKDGVDPLQTIPPTAKYERVVWTEALSLKDMDRKINIQLPTKAVPIFSSNIAALPADGFSQGRVEVRFENTIESVNQIKLTLNGPLTFLNGKKSLDLNGTDGLIQVTVMSENKPGTGEIIISGEDIESEVFILPIYGKPISLKVEKLNTVWVADDKNKLPFQARLYDKFDNQVLNVSSPLLVNVSGEGVNENSQAKDTVFFNNGSAFFNIISTFKAGTASIDASFRNLTSKTITTTSKKGEMQVRINPPEKIKLDSDGGWIPDHVTVFINFKTGGSIVENASNQVTLNVYSKEHKLLDRYTQKAKHGEVIFKDITYYQRPAQCLFEISCPGYETVVRKVFPNTWDLESNTKNKVVVPGH